MLCTRQYKVIGGKKEKMPKIDVTDDCIGCGACVSVCDKFEMAGKKSKHKNDKN